MLKLKQYQQRALDSLRRFFTRCGNILTAKGAFIETTEESFGYKAEYHSIENVEALKDLPYVCLRIPTGGGKTLLACHSIAITASEYKRTDNTLVLWLVPSNAILTQTIDALKNTSHPYRQALDSTLGSVVIKNIEEALYMSPADVSGATCIIVSTIQAFRRDNKDGLKVYQGDNGSLMSFFSSLASSVVLENLEYDSVSKKPVCSLANVIAMHRPIVIVDEAHNARTALSFEMLASFHPSCIIEFTATPDTKANPSNVLYSVSAQELKTEEMIKLPIVVEGRPNWHELLQDAINCRNNLEKIAILEKQLTGEYIRPIMLLQAEKKKTGNETVHAENLKDILVNDFRIKAEEIAIATGTTREIDGVDLFSPDCFIRYIITQQALREGWDCSFAYVLCTITESHSKIQVEQILGRILRMPKAKKKNFDELNNAYAFAPASFTDIASSLQDALTQNGFDKQEVERLIIQAQPTNCDEDDLFSSANVAYDYDFTKEETIFSVTPPDEKLCFTGVLEAKAEYKANEKKVVFKERMTVSDREKLKNIFPKDIAAINDAFIRSNKFNVKSLSPVESGAELAVPVLSICIQKDLFEIFDETCLLEYPWDISEFEARLTREEYSPRLGEIQRGKVDTEQGKIMWTFIEKVQQDTQYWDVNSAYNWELSDLVSWLDDRIPHSDITCQDATAFFNHIVINLMKERQFTMTQLVVDKFNLKNALQNKLNAMRLSVKKKAYQQFLLPEFETPLAVVPERCFKYPEGYPLNKRYDGKYKFKKHYYPIVGAFDSAEEEECAIYLDQMNDIAYWVRNLDQRVNESFWFQLSNGRFYPDFVCKLNDGRILIVEYKGAHLWTNTDSTEKRIIGELWAKRSQGKCLFIMPNGKNLECISNICIRG